MRRVSQLLIACALVLLALPVFAGVLAGAWPLAAASPPSVSASTSTAASTDILYLIDVSGSMVGQGVTNGNVLADLTRALTEEVNATAAGTDVLVATFADGLVDLDGPASDAYLPVRRFTIDPSDPRSSRQAIISYILGLDSWVRARADSSGQRTALYSSVLSAFGYLDACRADWERANPGVDYAAGHIQKVVVFTDGADNASGAGGVSRQDLISAYLRRRDTGALAGRFFLKVVTVPGIDLDLGEIPVERYGFASRPVEVICTPARLDFGAIAPAAAATTTLMVELHAQRPIPRTAIDCELEVSGLADPAPPGIDPGAPLAVSLSPAVIEGSPTDLVLAVTLGPRDAATLRTLEASARRLGSPSFGGTLTLTAANPSVEFLPATLSVAFFYGAAGTATVSPALGNDGILEGPRRRLGEQEATATYYVAFDKLAATSGLLVQADVAWEAGMSPSDLVLAARRAGLSNPNLVGFIVWRDGQPLPAASGPVLLDAGVTRLDVVVTLPAALDTALPAGDYPGSLVFTPLTAGTVAASAPATPEAVEAGAQDGTGGSLSLDIRFRLGRAPWPLWSFPVFGLALATAGTSLFALTRRPFSPGQKVRKARPGQAPRVESLRRWARRGLAGYRYDLDLGDASGADGPRASLRPAGDVVILRASWGLPSSTEPTGTSPSRGLPTGRHGSGRTQIRVNGVALEPAGRAGTKRHASRRLEHGDAITYGDVRFVCDFSENN